MDIRVGGHSCTVSAANESTNVGAIYFCFRFFAQFLNQSAWNAREVEKRGEISHFLTPCEKYGRAGGDVCRDYSCNTSVLSTGILLSGSDRRFGHINCG